MNAMDIRALVLINAKPAVGNDRDHVAFVGPPLALLDVAGKSALRRTVENLEQSGIDQITAVIETNPFYRHSQAAGTRKIDCRVVAPELFWRTCEGVFHQLVQGGAELVLIIRLGAYAEVDFEHVLQFHLDQTCRVTRVVQTPAPEVLCISASRRNDAASLFRSGLSKCRSECTLFPSAGYVNPLADARDLRQFAVDVLTLRTATQPAGKESRPGVWLSTGAVLENGSRIVAPAFIGSAARVRAGALVTRCTAIEHHAHVDCGTVVENSTVLPHVYVGAGLDVAHSVVGLGQIVNLRRGATVSVVDGKLIGQVAVGAGQRLQRAAAGILSLLPQALRRRLTGAESSEPPAQPPKLEPALRRKMPSQGEAIGAPTRVHESNTAGEFSSSLVVARRYGDQ